MKNSFSRKNQMKHLFLLSVIFYQFISELFALTEEAKNCNDYPDEEVTKQLHVLSDSTFIKLTCNATGQISTYRGFKWHYCDRNCAGNYRAASETDAWHMTTLGFQSLILDHVTTESTGFYCCNALVEVDMSTWSVPAIEKYALLVLPENFHPTLTASPGGPVEENTQVTLTCEIPSDSSLMNDIVPIIEWKLPETLSEPNLATANGFKYTAVESLDGKEFQCIAKYHLTNGSKEFASNIVFGKIPIKDTSENPEAISAESTSSVTAEDKVLTTAGDEDAINDQSTQLTGTGQKLNLSERLLVLMVFVTLLNTF